MEFIKDHIDTKLINRFSKNINHNLFLDCCLSLLKFVRKERIENLLLIRVTDALSSYMSYFYNISFEHDKQFFTVD